MGQSEVGPHFDGLWGLSHIESSRVFGNLSFRESVPRPHFKKRSDTVSYLGLQVTLAWNLLPEDVASWKYVVIRR